MIVDIHEKLEQKITNDVNNLSSNFIKWALLNNKKVENMVHWTLLINVHAEIEETLNPECMRLFR